MGNSVLETEKQQCYELDFSWTKHKKSINVYHDIKMTFPGVWTKTRISSMFVNQYLSFVLQKFHTIFFMWKILVILTHLCVVNLLVKLMFSFFFFLNCPRIYHGCTLLYTTNYLIKLQFLSIHAMVTFLPTLPRN